MKPFFLRSLLALSALLLPSSAPVEAEPAKPLKAFWVSPDWLLEGVATREHRASSAEARQVTGIVLDRMKQLGANSIMMESWLRGYSVGKVGSYPVYPLTRLSDGGDLMTIVLDEAGRRNLAVHAWVHCLFWRTDNPALTKWYHEGRSEWDDLTAVWLREGAARVSGKEHDAALACAAALEAGKEGALPEILQSSNISAREGVLQAFVPSFRAAGVPAPAWLVQTPEGDLHPSSAKDHWMTLYLNPAHPVVIERVTRAAKLVSRTYPQLAGVHLDHIRYPRGVLNIPQDMAAQIKLGHDWAGGTSGSLYKRWKALRSEREGHVTALVKGIKAVIRPEHQMSSAVHPLYYFERDEWTAKLSADDFVCQDWHVWGLDAAVPMIYDSDAPRVGRVLKKLRFGLLEREDGGARTQVVPGVNLLRLMKELPAWVYFDFDGLRQIKAGGTASAAKQEDEADGPSDTMD